MNVQQTSDNKVSRLAYFTVNKLYGYRKITLGFESDVKILIADNGSGKTTIMKMLVALLTGNISRLSVFEFESMEIGFRQNDGSIASRTIGSAEINLLSTDINLSHSPRLENVRRIIGPRRFDELLELTSGTLTLSQLRQHFVFLEADTTYPGLSSDFVEELKSTYKMVSSSDNVRSERRDLRLFIDTNFPFTVIYWPTYRRIEDELEFSDVNERGQARRDRQRIESAMNFGMQDIEERIAKFTDTIRSSTLRQYQSTNALMLNTLAFNPLPSLELIKQSLSRSKDLELVLSRLSTAIREPTRIRIMELINSKSIFDSKNLTLAFLLSNLISIYDGTKHGDEQIKRFLAVANGYLTDKYWHYDDIGVALQVKTKAMERVVPLGRLSSGEKQLISMLAKLYLAGLTEPRVAIFIDEPELSLSMEWQRKLLPDIISSERCALLVAATHSPFIFDNSLREHASPLFFEDIADNNTNTSLAQGIHD